MCEAIWCPSSLILLSRAWFEGSVTGAPQFCPLLIVSINFPESETEFILDEKAGMNAVIFQQVKQFAGIATDFY